MRIVHVTHRTWPAIGGSERYVLEVARRQVADGHQVTVVVTDAWDMAALWDRGKRRVGADTPTMQQGVSIQRLPVRHLPLGDVTFPALRRATWLASRLSGRVAMALAHFSPWIPSLRRVLAEEPADLFFAWNLTLESLTAAVAREAVRQDVPWIGVPLLHLGRDQFYTMRHQLGLLESARAVLAQTETERAFLIERGIPPDKVHIVSPGVDLAEARAADGERFRREHDISGPVVLTLGTLGQDKGTYHLLTAMEALWQEGQRATLVLVGPRQRRVERALARLPAEKRAFCRYLGAVPEAEKWDAVAAAAVVAMPSRTESFGIVYLEGWACGKPVVGARAGAVVDVIDEGRDGLLVAFGDVAGLAAALHKLLEDRELAGRLGAQGREKVVARYTWDQQYARLRDIVEDVERIWENEARET